MLFLHYYNSYRPYVVVETIENGNKAVQAVPTSFFVNNKYYYPTKKIRKIAVKKMMVADPTDAIWEEQKTFRIISDQYGKKLGNHSLKLLFLIAF